jgi:hypothetical protein
MNWLKIPEGEEVRIRILEPMPSHEFTMTVEEWERYQQATRDAAKDCPLCAAGVPHGRKQR